MSFINAMGQRLARFFGEETPLDGLSSSEFFSDCLDLDYFSDLLIYRVYDEERRIYENKSSLGFCIEVAPILGAGSEVQRELSTLIREIGEEGASIQCLSWADYRIDGFLNLWSKPRLEKGAIYAAIAHKKELFFKTEPSSGDVPPRSFRFLFSYSEPKSISQGFLQGSPIAQIKLLEKKKKALEVLGRISGDNAFELAPLQLMKFLSGLINVEKGVATDCRKKWDKDTWLSRQIGDTGSSIEVRREGLLFHGKEGTKSFKSYEVVDYPDQWALGLMGELLGDFFNKSYRIPSPFYIHYGIHFPVQQKTETKISGKIKILEHQTKFPALMRMFPEMAREHEEHLLVKRQILEGEKFVDTRLSCGFWAHPEKEIESASVLTALFQKYGFKIKENHFVHLPEFLSILPMVWGEESPYIKNLKRARCLRTTVTSETGSLVPILGEWWGKLQ